MKKAITIALVITTMIHPAYSQDTLTLLSGKIVTGTIGIETQEWMLLNSEHGTSRYYKDEVFSITRSSEIVYLYKPDSSNKFSLNLEEMKSYINGMQSAREHYRSPWSTAGGFISGAAGGALGFWGLALPATYVFISGSGNPKGPSLSMIENQDVCRLLTLPPQYGKMKNPESETKPENLDRNSLCFKSGYLQGASEIKTRNAIFGAIAGFVSLVVTTCIISATR